MRHRSAGLHFRFRQRQATTIVVLVCRRAPRFVRIGLALSMLPGCGSDGQAGTAAEAGASAAATADLRVVLGSGNEVFEPVQPDGVVPLIHGIQGAFHVWTSFLTYGFETDVVRMELATQWADLADSRMEMKGSMALHATVDPWGMPASVSIGWPASIFNPTCANGRRLEMTITVRDEKTGVSANDAQHWVVDVAEADRSSDCAP